MRKAVLILDADYDSNEDNTAIMIQDILKPINSEICRVCENIFPQNLDYEGFIITGSEASFDDKKEWITNLMQLIKRLHRLNKPLLGICFGHQLIAQALGGKVIHTNLHEFGYSQINLTEEGKREELFKGLIENFVCFQTHKDVVSELPPGSALLAANENGIQAYRLDNVYGVQFHPEISSALAIRMSHRYHLREQETIADTESLSKISREILKNFVSIL